MGCCRDDVWLGFEKSDYRTDDDASLPALQFGNALKSLHWNVMQLNRINNRRVYPGMLEQVDGNLRTQDLRRVKIDGKHSSDARVSAPSWILDTFGWNIRNRMEETHRGGGLGTHHIPSMHKFSKIQIDSRSCVEISLSELVDAAPNLKTLEIAGCECGDGGWMRDLAVFTGGEVIWVDTHPRYRTVEGTCQLEIPQNGNQSEAWRV
jgi:hypothetical protein